MTPALLGAYEQLRGEVLGLVQVDPDDPAMGEVDLGVDGGDGPAVRCTGPVADLVEGQWVTVVGSWREHHGQRLDFAAVSYERIPPEPAADRDGPMPLPAPVRWPPDVASAVHTRFGAQTSAIARSDPYRFLAVERVRFAHVDALGRHLGLVRTDPRRVRAAALAAVAASRREGHEHLGRDALVAATARLAGVDRLIAADGVTAAVDEGLLATERLGDVEVVTPPEALRAERELAADLLRLLRTDRSRVRSRPGGPSPDVPPPALRAVLSSPVSVLTGSRGTGLARAVAGIARVAEAAGLRVGEDLVVVDTDRCGDTAAFGRRVARIGDGAHLLVVGDPGLLPPRRPGRVLHDLVASGLVPVTSLTDAHPSGAVSRLDGLAREVLTGDVGVLRGADGDVFLAEEPTGGDLAARVARAVTQRIPEHLGVDLDGIQVLAPRNDGPAGVRAIGTRISQALGRPVGTRSVRTIHRAAGRSWPVVVLVVDASDRGVMDRRMLYTAVTRAEQALIVVGQAASVRAAARWERPVARRTGLCARLRP